MTRYYSNGKLLLTGEYVVLDGALSLAVPTKLGQSLEVKCTDSSFINWKSLNHNNGLWFEASFDVKTLDTQEITSISERLKNIIKAARHLNKNFLNENCGYDVITKLGFPENWGLGSSSTLINNIANWAKIDAYKLLNNTFGGSGYDIACASNNTAILYEKEMEIKVSSLDFNPSFKNKLFFIHLNRKQNSRDGIKHYNSVKGKIKKEISQISEITLKMIDCTSLKMFESLIIEHERLISIITNQETVKSKLFPDFKGEIKSLGAWGGDFVLASGTASNMNYFKDKGYKTIIAYKDMVL